MESDSKTEFALVLFAGLIVFNLFAEFIHRAPSLVLNNPNFVKNVYTISRAINNIYICAK